MLLRHRKGSLVCFSPNCKQLISSIRKGLLIYQNEPPQHIISTNRSVAQHNIMAFRSPGARPSPRNAIKEIPDGPIQDFTAIIKSTISEDWQKRVSSLQTLVTMIPATYENSNHEEWYNSPPTLRHLAKPVSDLLKDARSTVVKRTCEALGELFSKCKSDARYLLKDLMPTVCQVHGCTIHVIRNYVQIMVLETLPKVPCKMTMPVWLDRLKHDKSRTMREACSLYLSSAMADWGASDDGDFENENNGYLSRDIYHQVGSMLIKCLRDPSPIVRQNCKKGLEVLASQKRGVLDALVNDPNLTRDSRVMKLLRQLQAGETGLGDDISVSSRASVSSRVSRASVASAPVTRRGGSSRNQLNARPGAVPRSRRPIAGSSTMRRTPPPKIPTTIGIGPPRRVVGRKSPASRIPPKSPPVMVKKSVLAASPGTPKSASSASPSGMSLSTPTKKLLGNGTNNKESASTPVTPLEYEIEKEQSSNDGNLALIEVNQSFDSQDSDASVLRPIATAEQLRKKAQRRTMGTSNRRRSSLLHDRMLRSPKPVVDASLHSRGGGGTTTNNLAVDVSRLSLSEISNHPHLPMHTKIAYELLEAHKLHVDQIMETLKVEMDALKDFELIMLEKGPVRPTEEEVLEYFESLGLCLEQRKKAGSIMQKRMDRISQG